MRTGEREGVVCLTVSRSVISQNYLAGVREDEHREREREWYMKHDFSALQERGSAALSSTPPVGTSQARAAAAGAAWVLDVSADPPSSGQLGARGGPDAGGPSEVGGSGRRMLSRANSRVLQWVMRDEGNALASEDLMETLDVEDMNRDGGKVWRITSMPT